MSFTFYLQGKNSNYVTTCLCEKRKVIIFIIKSCDDNPSLKKDFDKQYDSLFLHLKEK